MAILKILLSAAYVLLMIESAEAICCVKTLESRNDNRFRTCRARGMPVGASGNRYRFARGPTPRECSAACVYEPVVRGMPGNNFIGGYNTTLATPNNPTTISFVCCTQVTGIPGPVPTSISCDDGNLP